MAKCPVLKTYLYLAWWVLVTNGSAIFFFAVYCCTDFLFCSYTQIVAPAVQRVSEVMISWIFVPAGPVAKIVSCTFVWDDLDDGVFNEFCWRVFMLIPFSVGGCFLANISQSINTVLRMKKHTEIATALMDGDLMEKAGWDRLIIAFYLSASPLVMRNRCTEFCSEMSTQSVKRFSVKLCSIVSREKRWVTKRNYQYFKEYTRHSDGWLKQRTQLVSESRTRL